MFFKNIIDIKSLRIDSKNYNIISIYFLCNVNVFILQIFLM